MVSGGRAVSPRLAPCRPSHWQEIRLHQYVWEVQWDLRDGSYFSWSSTLRRGCQSLEKTYFVHLYVCVWMHTHVCVCLWCEWVLDKDSSERQLRQHMCTCVCERERDREMENMFALFTPICLCGSALTSMWAGREAEYAKQLEQRLITLELLCKKKKKRWYISLTLVEARQVFCIVWRKNTGCCHSFSR